MRAILLLSTVVELASTKYDMVARLVNMFVSPQEVLMLEDMSLIHIAKNSDCTFLGSLKGEKSKTHIVTIHPNDLAALLRDQKSLNSSTGIRNKKAVVFRIRAMLDYSFHSILYSLQKFLTK